MTNSAPLAKRHNFTGNDVATSFSYTKKISNQDHIKLVHTDTAGLENALADPLVVDVDYTVNGVGDAGGGTVDFPKAGSVYSTLATGEKLSIIYDFPTEQQLDVPNTGRVFSVNVEDQLDYITNLISQNEELLDRALKLVEGSTLTGITFPEGISAANRASKVAVWNAAGLALELLAVTAGLDVAPIAVKGDIAQGDAAGDPAKLAIGGTGAILSVVAGLLAYTAIGSTNDTLQVVAGVPAWVTNPTILIPTIADLTNMPHDHQNAGGGGATLTSPTIVTPTIADLVNMNHTHLSTTQGGTLVGRSVQVVNVQSGAVATGTTVMISDDSIPQNDEGDEYMTLAITPTNTNNKLKIEVQANIANSTNNPNLMALFQDSTASALAATANHSSGTNVIIPLVLTHYMTAGTTSATTFKVRVGTVTAGTITFNGSGGARKFGDVMASSITITEIQV